MCTLDDSDLRQYGMVASGGVYINREAAQVLNGNFRTYGASTQKDKPQNQSQKVDSNFDPETKGQAHTCPGQAHTFPGWVGVIWGVLRHFPSVMSTVWVSLGLVRRALWEMC